MELGASSAPVICIVRLFCAKSRQCQSALRRIWGCQRTALIFSECPWICPHDVKDDGERQPSAVMAVAVKIKMMIIEMADRQQTTAVSRRANRAISELIVRNLQVTCKNVCLGWVLWSSQGTRQVVQCYAWNITQQKAWFQRHSQRGPHVTSSKRFLLRLRTSALHFLPRMV